MKVRPTTFETGLLLFASRQHPPDFRGQRVGRAGFRDEPIASGEGCALELGRAVVSSERHDRDVRGARIRLQPPRGFPAVYDRETQIHHDDIGLTHRGAFYGIGSVGRLNDVEAAYREMSRVQDAQGAIILGDEKKRPIAVGPASELCGGTHPFRLSHAACGRLI